MSFEINYSEFKKDIENVRNELQNIPSKLSSDHFWKIYNLSNFFYWLGMFSLPLSPCYIFSWFFLSLGIFAKWTMIGHHVCHGGYDKNTNVKFNRKTFGIKTLYRRTVDWFDWWLVEAWNIEHNNIHHYNLGEKSDPDLVEENLKVLRQSHIPNFIKKILIIPLACFWKIFYYAPNTYIYYCLNKLRINDINQYKKIPQSHFTSFSIFSWFINYRSWMGGLFIKVLFPYFFAMFVIIPYFFISLNYIFNLEICISNVLCNLFLTEISTNIHSFIIISPNHCGDDLYRFDTHVTPKSGEFYLRQIISSSNYTAGNDFIDFLQGWLNYQIEHHLFPDLSMLQYRYAIPMVKEVCLKHSIPYVQENVFIRLSKTIDIMTGKTSMKKFINKS